MSTYYRHRALGPFDGPKGTAVTVREGGGATEVYISVGPGSRGFGMDYAEAWALWRCLDTALHNAEAGNHTPPHWLTDPTVSPA